MIDPRSQPVPADAPTTGETDAPTTSGADAPTSATRPTQLTVDSLRTWLSAEDAPCVVDVRSPAEFESGHIPGAVNVPLPMLKEHGERLGAVLPDPVVLVCRTGNRSAQAQRLLNAAGRAPHVLPSGMTGWQAAEAPVETGTPRWDLERQVRLVAGGLVAAGVAASVVAPRAKWLSGAVGGGLMTAALTDSCLMGSLLSKLPYNRGEDPSVDDVVASLQD